MAAEPSVDCRCSMGGQVVADQVNVEFGGHCFVDRAQKFFELFGKDHISVSVRSPRGMSTSGKRRRMTAPQDDNGNGSYDPDGDPDMVESTTEQPDQAEGEDDRKETS